MNKTLDKICVEIYKGYENFINDIVHCSIYCDTREQADEVHALYCGKKSFEGIYYYTAG